MRYSILVLLLFSMTTFGCRSVDFFAAPKTLTNSDYQKDWNIFRQALEEYHPALAAYHSEQEIDSYLNSQEIRIESVMDYNSFYAILSETIDYIGDGHTGVYHPDWYWETTETGRFPMDLYPEKDRLFVLYENGFIPIGSEIIEIDGKKTAEILNDLKIYTTGDGYPKPFETDLLAAGFSDFYSNHFGSKDSYSIRWLSVDGRNETFSIIKGWSPSDDELEYEENYIKTPDPYSFSIIDNNRAYLSINSFEFSEEEGFTVNSDDYLKFLNDTFKQLKTSEHNELILDLRQNGGGDPFLLAELLSYLIDETFVLDKKTFARTNTIPLKQYILPSQKKIVKEIEWELKEFTKRDDSGLYVYEPGSVDDVIEIIPKDDLLFTGDLKVLVSYSTFSAAGMCSAILKNRTDAITIGQETSGGYTRLCAAADFDYRLPSTGIHLSIPTVGLLTNIVNERYPAGRGTIPDILVNERIFQLIEGLDPEMEAALAN